MAIWEGYPYERLPAALKSPARLAIVGAALGVIAGLLSGFSPFVLGVGLLAAGAAIGLAVSSKAKEYEDISRASQVQRVSNVPQEQLIGIDSLQKSGDARFQELLQRQAMSVTGPSK